MDLVTNSPSLDDPILRARFGTRSQMNKVMEQYAERQYWLYDARTDILTPLRSD
jgi:hypothetical protein